MSKKITSLLSLLVAFFVASTAMAQLSELDHLTLSVGVAVENFEPNTWYLLHQGRVSGGDGYCPAGSQPSQGGYMTDPGVDGSSVLKMNINNVTDASLAKEKAAYLVRFVPLADNPLAYNIQFGTGRWLTAPTGTGNSKNLQTSGSVYDAGNYNVYAIDPDQPGYFALNVSDSRGDYQELLDNNGVDRDVVTWDSGQKTSVGGNSVWSIVEVYLDELDEHAALLAELSNVYDEYYNYYLGLVPGTDPGLYSPELVEALGKALADANMDDNPDIADNMTDDEIRALIQTIKDAYEAALASKVPMTLAEGYYFIKTAMPYQTTITDEETQETRTLEVDKYMYSSLTSSGIFGMWGSPDYDCQKLWYVKPLEEGRFDIESKATDSRFDEVARSTSVTMSTASTSEMVVTPIITKDGVTIVNINVYGQNADDGLYLHQGNHGASGGIGTGQGSNLVGWYSSYNYTDDYPQGSEWTFIPVSSEEALQMIADYEPVKNRDLMLARYDSIMENAKKNLDIAIDIQHIRLIQDVAQLSSPYNEPKEGSLANLLDGNTTTFWHSNWSDGAVEGGIHYLQVDLVEPVDDDIYIAFTRRPVSNDHVTQLSVCGTNDPDAAKEDCEELLLWDTPFGVNTESFQSELFSTNHYQYIRLYAETTTNNRGYWHMSELQMGYDTPNENAQIRFMGDLGTNLQAVIEELEQKDREDIEVEDYERLKAAYDAFMQKFVDPTELREVLSDLAGTADVVVEGDQPGFWSDGALATAFNTLYEEAKAYDASGNYTPAQSQQYIDQLTKQSEDIYTSANKVQTGKWYRIRFGTEEEFEQHGWDPVAGNGSEKTPSLFGKYVSTANYINDEGYEIIESVDAENVGLGSNLRFLAEEDLAEDGHLFRFVEVGDSAFLLQNKATNLFLRAAGTSGFVTLSAHPTLFTVRAIGYGENVISAKNLTGDYQSNLHAQVTGNVLVTWDVDYPGSRSGLYIEEVEDVAGDYEGTEFNVPVYYSTLNAYCFPVEVSVEAGQNAELWTVNAVEDTKVSLARIEGTVQAGRPFFLAYGDLTIEPDLEGDAEMVVMKHGYTIGATEPQTESALKGSFYGEVVGAGVIVAKGNTLAISKTSNTAVGANSAYIALDEPYEDLDATVVVDFTDQPDGIAGALANVSRSGAVYTIDGRLVSKKATLSDLQKFGKGLYILNGTKVIVK